MRTAVSLFSGCGGSDLGLARAGFEILMANDILEYARDTYLHNMETDYRLGSVENIRAFPESDLLVGCYPCQGFSQGGVREAGRKINYLYREFDRALRLIKPKAFIVENVSGMLNSNNQLLLNNQITRFRMAGYKVVYKLLDARFYGLPQERKRLFIVGIRSDLGETYDFPEPTHSVEKWNPKLKNTENLPHCPSIGDALSGMPLWPEGEYVEQDFHWYYLSRDRYRGWDEASKTIVANCRHMPLHPVSPRLVKKGPDKWVFDEDRPARRLSYKEGALLQGFPKDFELPDVANLTKKYTVVGNAVPPPLFEVVARGMPDIW